MNNEESPRSVVNHNVQPIIGWMRLALADGTSLSAEQMESAVKKLYLALESVDTHRCD